MNTIRPKASVHILSITYTILKHILCFLNKRQLRLVIYAKANKMKPTKPFNSTSLIL